MTKFYNHTTYPAPNSQGSSEGLRAELDAIEAGFDLVETLKADRTDLTDIEATANAANSAVASLTTQMAALEAAFDSLGSSTGEVSGDLGFHLADATDAHDASAISVSPTGNIVSTDVQSALAWLDANKASATALTNHINGTGAHPASSIAFTAGGGIASTNVQAAISELNGAKASTGSVTTLSNTVAAYSSAISALQTNDTTLSNSISGLQSQISGINTSINSINTSLAGKAATSHNHAASAITVTPAGNLGSNNVQSALQELQTDVDSKVGPTGTVANATQAVNATAVNGVAQPCGYSVAGQPISYNSIGGPQVMNTSGSAAMQSYHRQGAFGVNFGLDTDNILKIGGWSMGAVSYQMLYPGTPNAPGVAPCFACRAWVTFDGTTGGILASGNISSIVRTAAGRYTINFATAMQDANYAVIPSSAMNAAGSAGIGCPFSTGSGYQAPSASSFIMAFEKRSDGAAIDMPRGTLAVFR